MEANNKKTKKQNLYKKNETIFNGTQNIHLKIKHGINKNSIEDNLKILAKIKNFDHYHNDPDENQKANLIVCLAQNSSIMRGVNPLASYQRFIEDEIIKKAEEPRKIDEKHEQDKITREQLRKIEEAKKKKAEEERDNKLRRFKNTQDIDKEVSRLTVEIQSYKDAINRNYSSLTTKLTEAKTKYEHEKISTNIKKHLEPTFNRIDQSIYKKIEQHDDQYEDDSIKHLNKEINNLQEEEHKNKEILKILWKSIKDSSNSLTINHKIEEAISQINKMKNEFGNPKKDEINED